MRQLRIDVYGSALMEETIGSKLWRDEFFCHCTRACSDRLKVQNCKADNQNLKLYSLGPGIPGRKSRLLSSLLKNVVLRKTIPTHTCYS